MTTPRVPPHDLEAERALLGALVLEPDLHDEVAGQLAAEDFYATRHQLIWRAVCSLRARGEPVETITIRAELGDDLPRAGGDDALLALLDTIPTMAGAQHSAKRISQLARVRRLILASAQVMADGYATPADDAEAFADLAELRILDAGRDRGAEVAATTIGDAASKALARALELQRAPRHVLGAPTGLSRLDTLLSGLQPGMTYVLAGRPGSGKTAAALGMLLAAARAEAPALMFSLEMPASQLAARALSQQSGVDGWRMSTGQLGHDDPGRLVDAERRLRALPLSIIDKPGTTILDVRREARRVMRRHGHLAVVAIDYLQLVRPVERRRSREEEVSEQSRLCHEMAAELGCAVLVLAQLNREVEKRGRSAKPQLSDLRESGAIEQDADAVIFVHREELQNDSPEVQGLADLIVAKHRHGPTGTVRTHFDKACTRFADLDDRR